MMEEWMDRWIDGRNGERQKFGSMYVERYSANDERVI